MNQFDKLHDGIERELENGQITEQEAYQYHREVEQEEQDRDNF